MCCPHLLIDYAAMPFPSSWISQTIAAQNSMFLGMQSYAQSASYGAGIGGPPQATQMMPPPPPPTLGGVMRGMGPAGSWGENLAGHMVGGAQMGMGLAGAGMAGLGVAGSLGLIGGPMGMAASMMDPMGLAMRAGAGAFGMAGGGMGGLAAGGLAAGAVALPMYAASQWAGSLANNFRGGMQDQMALNSTLRQNFNFMGGQGAFGRGFSQSQMGQIGGLVSQEARNNVFTSAGELNQLIAGGAQMGQFSGVRDTQEFARRFREMISTLRTVQRELGGSLQEAQEFVNQSRAAGVFGSTAATRFAGRIRDVSATTGFDQGQLLQLASQGSQIARTFGGRGEQGANGALRGISQVSTMLQGGMISEGMLSEATGGLTGQDAQQAFVANMMQRTGQFSRTAAGRYSIFGLSNARGTGLDEGAMSQFMSGDMTPGMLSRRAHQVVGGLGRARALNREGQLRGSLMEEGGIAGQLGMMRMVLGDRAMDSGDDLGSLVMQRRFHMSRPESEIMMQMMRNQGNIASREAADTAGSRRESALRSDITERRSIDSFTRHLEHEVQDATGMLRARDLGRTFVTRISSMAERAMNDLLGISSDQMSSEGQAAMSRIRQGRGSAADFSAMGVGSGLRSQHFDINQRGLFETGQSAGEALRARGMRTGGISTFSDAARALQTARDADRGALTDSRDVQGLYNLRQRGGTGPNADYNVTAQILRAQLAAGDDQSQVYRLMQQQSGGTTTGNAVAAYMSQNGIANGAMAPGMGTLLGRGGAGGVGVGAIAQDLSTLGRGMTMGGAVGGPAGAALGLLGTAGAMMFRVGGMRSEIDQASRPRGTDAVDFLAAGGHLAASIRGSSTTPTAAQQQTLAAISRVSREDVRSLQGSGEFMSRMRAAVTSGSGEAQQAAMRDLQTHVAGLDPTSSEGRAARSMLAQMQQSLATNHGQLGSEFLSFVRDDPALQAAQAQLAEYRSGIDDMARRGTGRGSRIMSQYGEALDHARSGEEASRAQADRQQAFNRMSDSEYAEFVNAASRTAGGELDVNARAEFAGISRGRAMDRELRGEGRRGGRGAIDAAFGAMTGYSMGSMELSIGGRSVSGTRAQRMIEQAFSGGGGMSRGRRMSIQQQFMQNLENPEGMGFSETQAREAREIMRGAMSHRDRRTGAFDEADRMAISEFTGRRDIQTAMQEGQQRQQQQSLEAAQQRDPIGRAQVDLLRSIDANIGRIAPPDPTTPPHTNT